MVDIAVNVLASLFPIFIGNKKNEKSESDEPENQIVRRLLQFDTVVCAKSRQAVRSRYTALHCVLHYVTLRNTLCFLVTAWSVYKRDECDYRDQQSPGRCTQSF